MFQYIVLEAITLNLRRVNSIWVLRLFLLTCYKNIKIAATRFFVPINPTSIKVVTMYKSINTQWKNYVSWFYCDSDIFMRMPVMNEIKNEILDYKLLFAQYCCYLENRAKASLGIAFSFYFREIFQKPLPLQKYESKAFERS